MHRILIQKCGGMLLFDTEKAQSMPYAKDSADLYNIVCSVELLHLLHEGCMDLVKHDRFLRQLLADVL